MTFNFRGCELNKVWQHISKQRFTDYNIVTKICIFLKYCFPITLMQSSHQKITKIKYFIIAILWAIYQPISHLLLMINL